MNRDKFHECIEKMMSAATLGPDGKLKIIDEAAMKDADALLGQVIVEVSSDWWALHESAESALGDLDDEVTFADKDADVSHVSSRKVDGDKKADKKTVESMLGGSGAAFNLRDIFAESDMDGDDDTGMVDGDDEFDSLRRGDDDDGLGDDGIGGDDDTMDGDDDMDAIGADDDFGDDDGLGGDAEFDFNFLTDPDDDMGGDDSYPPMDGDDDMGADGDDDSYPPMDGDDDMGADGDDDDSYPPMDDEGYRG